MNFIIWEPADETSQEKYATYIHTWLVRTKCGESPEEDTYEAPNRNVEDLLRPTVLVHSTIPQNINLVQHTVCMLKLYSINRNTKCGTLRSDPKSWIDKIHPPRCNGAGWEQILEALSPRWVQNIAQVGYMCLLILPR